MRVAGFSVAEWGATPIESVSPKSTFEVQNERESYAQRALMSRLTVMIRYSIIFAIIALIAAFFGFTDVAVASAGIAKVLFFIAITVFLVLLLAGISIGKKITGGGGQSNRLDRN